MANNYADGTGLLRVTSITPVILALFEGWTLRPSEEVEPGAFHISTENEESDWDSLTERLVGVAQQHGLELQADEEGDPRVVIQKLAVALGNQELGTLQEWLEQEGFDEPPTLDAMLTLALHLDDGHGITSISLETAHTCDKMRLWEFGGVFQFHSSSYELTVSTCYARLRCDSLSEALLRKDEDAVASLIASVASDWMDFADADLAERIRGKVSRLLAGPG